MLVYPESDLCSLESPTRRRGCWDLRALNGGEVRTFSCYGETSRLICCVAGTSEGEKHVSLPVSVRVSIRTASGVVLREDCKRAALEGIKPAAQ